METNLTTALERPEGKRVWCEKCGCHHQSSFSPTADPCLAHLSERDGEGGLVPCKNAAAYGSTVCPKHGIGYRDKEMGGRPLVSKYRDQLSPTLLARIERSLNDPDLLSLREDLAVVEAMIAGRIAGLTQEGGSIAMTPKEQKHYLHLLAAKRKLSEAERVAIKDAKAFVSHREMGRLIEVLLGIWVGILKRHLAGQPALAAGIARDLREATARFGGEWLGRGA